MKERIESTTCVGRLTNRGTHTPFRTLTAVNSWSPIRRPGRPRVTCQGAVEEHSTTLVASDQGRTAGRHVPETFSSLLNRDHDVVTDDHGAQWVLVRPDLDGFELRRRKAQVVRKDDAVRLTHANTSSVVNSYTGSASGASMCVVTAVDVVQSSGHNPDVRSTSSQVTLQHSLPRSNEQIERRTIRQSTPAAAAERTMLHRLSAHDGDLVRAKTQELVLTWMNEVHRVARGVPDIWR